MLKNDIILRAAAFLIVIFLPLFLESHHLVAFGRKERAEAEKTSHFLKNPPELSKNVEDLPQHALTGYTIEFTALVGIIGNEPHTHAVLSDTKTGIVYRVCPLESEKLLYSYQGHHLRVTGKIIDEPADSLVFSYDATINPSGWKVLEN